MSAELLVPSSCPPPLATAPAGGGWYRYLLGGRTLGKDSGGSSVLKSDLPEVVPSSLSPIVGRTYRPQRCSRALLGHSFSIQSAGPGTGTGRPGHSPVKLQEVRCSLPASEGQVLHGGRSWRNCSFSSDPYQIRGISSVRPGKNKISQPNGLLLNTRSIPNLFLRPILPTCVDVQVVSFCLGASKASSFILVGFGPLAGQDVLLQLEVGSPPMHDKARIMSQLSREQMNGGWSESSPASIRGNGVRPRRLLCFLCWPPRRPGMNLHTRLRVGRAMRDYDPDHLDALHGSPSMRQIRPHFERMPLKGVPARRGGTAVPFPSRLLPQPRSAASGSLGFALGIWCSTPRFSIGLWENKPKERACTNAPRWAREIQRLCKASVSRRNTKKSGITEAARALRRNKYPL